MPRNEANCTAINTFAFRDAFWSAIDSSAGEDESRAENDNDPYSEEKATAWERNQAGAPSLSEGRF